jgi:mRNA-degrading endonuclease YafQ of YafQ-DinJ toxin-antitoxin module
MRTLVLTTSFKRSFKSLIRKEPQLEAKIAERLRLLVIDPFHPSLRTHKLKGTLSGAWSCTVDYDCRIIFNFKKLQTLIKMRFFLLILEAMTKSIEYLDHNTKHLGLGCASFCLSPLPMLKRVGGIEPPTLAWKAKVLPLNYTRNRVR